MNCKICNDKTDFFLKKKVLNKYTINYYSCPSCNFIQTESPFWLEEAYSSAIAELDIGLISRNIILSKVTSSIIENHLNPEEKFLDFGGGYGMFVRMMRDKGYQFYRDDKYCNNLFAKHFDLNDLIPQDRHFELITAFEVLEHLVDPFKEISKILNYGTSFLFSTELQPKNDLKNWWYFVPETGQHISLFSIKSLKIIAQKCNLNFFTNGSNLHLLTNKTFDTNPFQVNRKNIIKRGISKIRNTLIKPPKSTRESLLQMDFEYVKNKLNSD